MGLGEYSASVKVFKDGKIIKEEKESFRVVKEGTLDYSFGEDFRNDNKQMDFVKTLLIFLALAVIAVTVIMIKRKRKKKKKEAEADDKKILRNEKNEEETELEEREE